MGWMDFFLIGIGLSMDAFAVAVCRGLQMRNKILWKHTIIIALFFGGFQALMPLLGWALGKQFEQYITSVDHWIAFILLLFIGGKMILDVIKDIRKGEPGNVDAPSDTETLALGQLLVMALATSIDALAVGITFAFLDVAIEEAISIIGLTTFALSFAGVAIGHVFGTKYQNKATLAGGIILICIGTKILLEHLGILSI